MTLNRRLREALSFENEIRAGDLAFEEDADLVFEAARVVLDARQIYWCEEHHHSSGRRDRCPYGFNVETTPCRIVPARLFIDTNSGGAAASPIDELIDPEKEKKE